MIGDEPNMLAVKRSEFLRFKNIETGLHASHATRVFRRRMHRPRPNREQRDEDREMYKSKVRPLESGQRVPAIETIQ